PDGTDGLEQQHSGLDRHSEGEKAQRPGRGLRGLFLRLVLDIPSAREPRRPHSGKKPRGRHQREEYGRGAVEDRREPLPALSARVLQQMLLYNTRYVPAQRWPVQGRDECAYAEQGASVALLNHARSATPPVPDKTSGARATPEKAAVSPLADGTALALGDR